MRGLPILALVAVIAALWFVLGPLVLAPVAVFILTLGLGTWRMAAATRVVLGVASFVAGLGWLLPEALQLARGARTVLLEPVAVPAISVGFEVPAALVGVAVVAIVVIVASRAAQVALGVVIGGVLGVAALLAWTIAHGLVFIAHWIAGEYGLPWVWPVRFVDGKPVVEPTALGAAVSLLAIVATLVLVLRERGRSPGYVARKAGLGRETAGAVGAGQLAGVALVLTFPQLASPIRGAIEAVVRAGVPATALTLAGVVTFSTLLVTAVRVRRRRLWLIAGVALAGTIGALAVPGGVATSTQRAIVSGFGGQAQTTLLLATLVAMLGVRQFGGARLASAYLARPYDADRRRCWHERSEFQRHLDFFDTNRDGVLSVLETHRRLRQLDVSLSVFGMRFYFVTALILNIAIGRRTWQFVRPMYSLTVNTDAAHLISGNPHTEVWDTAGRYTKGKLDGIFRDWDGDLDDVVEASELEEVRTSLKRTARGAYGRFKAFLTTRAELPALFMVLRRTPRRRPQVSTSQISKSDLEAFYKGGWLYAQANEDVPDACTCADRRHERAPLPALAPGSA